MKRVKIIFAISVLTLLLGIQVNATGNENQKQKMSAYASLTVGGITIINGGEVTGEAPDGVTYDEEENLLTLTNYSCEAGAGATAYNVAPAIGASNMGDDFTIRLVGENTISAASEYADTLLALSGTIEGPGTLNILNVAGQGLTYSNMTIDGCTINITSGPWEYGTYGIMGSLSEEGDLIIKNSTVNISSSKPTGSWVGNFGIDTQAGNLTVENSELNIEVTNGNTFCIAVGRIMNGSISGGWLNVNDSVIKCISNTDMYVDENTKVNWPMYFYGISSTDELNYYTVEEGTFVKSDFDDIFGQNSNKRYEINESVIISSTPLAEYCAHEWDEGIVTTEPSCENTGEMTYTCTVCGETKTEEITALGHIWGEWQTIKEAECTEDGICMRTCSRCNRTETEVIPQLDHDFVAKVLKEPTCTEPGMQERTCSRCDLVIGNETIPATGHDYEWVVEKEATFHEDGVKKGTCNKCGDVITERIPKLSESHEHNFSGREEIIKPATCTEEGSKNVYCTEPECGEYIIETIPMTTHTLGEWTTVREATCSENGLEKRTCTVCGAVIETRVMDKAPHTYGDWTITVDPTCTEAGIETAVCTVCGEKTVRGVNPLGHDYAEWKVIKESTMTSEGERQAVCTVCGEVKTEIIPKLSALQPAVSNENIEENNTNNKTNSEDKSNVPKTGDESSFLLYIMLLAVATAVSIITVKKQISK